MSRGIVCRIIVRLLTTLLLFLLSMRLYLINSLVTVVGKVLEFSGEKGFDLGEGGGEGEEEVGGVGREGWGGGGHGEGWEGIR